MNVEFTRDFEKQIDNIRDAKLKKEIADVVRNVMSARTRKEVANIKKLKGFTSAYRIRSGSYRIGIVFRNGNVIFAAFAHRKDIYKIFP